jgi:hypothetical protein
LEARSNIKYHFDELRVMFFLECVVFSNSREFYTTFLLRLVPVSNNFLIMQHKSLNIGSKMELFTFAYFFYSQNNEMYLLGPLNEQGQHHLSSFVELEFSQKALQLTSAVFL